MRVRLSLIALGCAATGLAASIASTIDDFGASAAFCAESGCDTVRQSAWAHPLGVPMPVLGLAFFTAALVLAFVQAPRLRRALAIAGALWAVLLIAVQAFVLGAWCKLCLIADPAAIGYGLAVLAGATTLRLTVARALATAPAVLAVLGAIGLWTGSAPPSSPSPTSPTSPRAGHPPHAAHDLPDFVAAAQVPGTATVVEVIDFECPFCRRMQDRLTAAIARAAVPVRIVRKMFPLRMHPHAMPAAVAYCCAEAQGKGDAMAAALFAADPDELTPEGCEQLAARVGCDLERYRRDLAQAELRVAADTAEVRAAGIRSLPTLFIGGEPIVGATRSTDELVAMLTQAARS